MSGNNMSEEKKDSRRDEKQFIRERIERPKKERSIVKAVLLVCVLGILFGVMAAVSFFVSNRVINGAVPTTEEAQESVSIPRDQLPEETETETLPETTAPPETETTVDETQEEVFRETVEEIIKDYLKAQETEEKKETEPAAITKIKEIRNNLRRNLVTVTSLQAEEDVFKHTYTRSQESFGIIVAVTAKDVRILTESYLLEDADAVRITLGNGSEREASLMEEDSITGMAVVSIPVESLDPGDSAFILPAVLGNSYMCSPGDMIVALGRPLTKLPSVAWGIISYIENDAQGTDFNYDLIRTDIMGDAGAGGVLVNAAGEVVGWIRDSGTEADHLRISAVSISDLKGMIECLSNGSRISLLGVQTEEVTPLIAEEQELPQGLYITNTISDSPAFTAGIQNGDVLIKINEEEIKTSADLQNAMQTMRPETEVTVTVMREGREGFAELEFPLTLGKR
ncbi:MAG: serine protease [Lachnospiraceae bacterium]|nr:serine protease [Lachnospiraceae bacterium]